MEAYLNDRCTYTLNKEFITPYIFQINRLKHSRNTLQRAPLLAEFFFPNTHQVKQAVLTLGADSRQLLSNMASELAARLLNFRNSTQSDQPAIGDLIIIPDRLTRQQFPSLLSALGRIITKKGRAMYIKMLDRVVLNPHNQ